MTSSQILVLLVFCCLIIAVYACELLLLSIYCIRKLTRRKGKNILFSKLALVIHFLAVVGIVCCFYAVFVEPFWIEVNTIAIPTEKLSKTSFRVVHISDLHCGTVSGCEKKLVRIVNSLNPDVIVFTGDSIMNSAALPLFKDTMRQMKANIAKYAVRGNWDYFFAGLDFFGDTGFELLEQKAVAVRKNGEQIIVCGSRWFNREYFKKIIKAKCGDCFNIFLHHRPDLIEDVNNAGISLYLCGHTHGGQIALPFYGAFTTLSKFGKKYEAGMYHVGDTMLYVNRGIGMEGRYAPKIRFFARPEITVFDIRPAKDSK